MRIAVLASVAMALLAAPRPAGAEWFAQAEAGPVYESNISHGQLQRDIKHDTALELSASGGQHIMLGEYNSVSAVGETKAAAYDRYGGLNHLDLGVGFLFKRKAGWGATAPWWGATWTANRLDYRSELRDGWLYTVSLGTGKRFTEKWNLRADYRYDRRTADQGTGTVRGLSGAVFNQKNRTAQLDAEYAYDEAVSVSIGYARRTGDIVATTQRNATIFAASTAIAADPVFGTDTFAYKLSATVHILFFGMSKALNRRSSLNFAFERQIAHGTCNNDYYDNIGRVLLAYTF